MQDTNFIKKELICHWFYNVKTNLANKEILLLNFKSKNVFKKFYDSNLLKDYQNLTITFLQKLSKKDLSSMNQRNIILVECKEISCGHLEVFKNENIEILFYEITSLEQLEKYIHFSIHCQQKTMIPHEYSRCFFLKKIDPRDIVYSVDYAKYFIATFLNYKEDNGLKFNEQSVKLFLLRNMYSITIDTILKDIQYFELKGILTSRLAIFVYKICTFYYSATDKEIGTFYTNILGRSKVYNNKRLEISNTKGYLVQNVQRRIEYNTRAEIASYLLKYSGCDKQMISDATKLSLNELNNL